MILLTAARTLWAGVAMEVRLAWVSEMHGWKFDTPMPWREAKTRILATIAARLGKQVCELQPWVDYDPISVDEEAHHMSQGHSGVRWAGD